MIVRVLNYFLSSGYGLIISLLAVFYCSPVIAHATDNKHHKRVPDSQTELTLSFAPIVKKTIPAVVNIYSKKIHYTKKSPLFNDPIFRDFFDAFNFNFNEQRIQSSLGSGVIVQPNGFIITNHHIVENTKKLIIALNDGREFNAKIISVDPSTDLAVLKIDIDSPLPFLHLQKSTENLEVGDIVLAIGNPYGVGQTVTQGIISALGRSVSNLSDSSFFIQTDAAINPGNSGGALIDLKGKLIGINTAIFSRSQGSNGIGFAIPADMVRQVLNSSLTSGKVIKPWFGVKVTPLSYHQAISLKLNEPKGVIVHDIHPFSASAKSNLKIGDIIVKINNHIIDSQKAIDYYFSTNKLGDRVKVIALRNKQPINLVVQAQAMPKQPLPDIQNIQGKTIFSGLKIANLSPAFAKSIGINVFQTGIIILNVKPGSFAHLSGFRPGDLLLKLNNVSLKKTSEIKEFILKEETQRSVSISIKRNGKTITSTLCYKLCSE